MSAVAANDAAYLIARRLRSGFDGQLYEQGETFAGEALAMSPAMPAFAGYFTNTACELRTQKARASRDLDLAKKTLEQCRRGLDLLTAAAQAEPAAIARQAVADAEAL